MTDTAYFEELEDKFLALYAVKSKHSQGRRYNEKPSPNRTCFHRDRDRIIHSRSFRRLKHKTQVFVSTVSDHYRTRLTHTLEVAQISRHFARLLRLNEDLAESIALAHDLGHPPFGHCGERSLNRLLEAHGGFEHNLQSLRVVDVLENKYPDFLGLNLSFEVREGLVKRRTRLNHPQLDSVEGFTTLEAQVCNIADEIAYNNHDLDDGLTSGILTESDVEREVTLWREIRSQVERETSNFSFKERFTLINSRLITHQIYNVMSQTLANLSEYEINSPYALQRFNKPLVEFSVEMAEKNKELRQFLARHLYAHPNVIRMNREGQLLVSSLFGFFVKNPDLMPVRYKELLGSDLPTERVVADYIAGMTDAYARSKAEDYLN